MSHLIFDAHLKEALKADGDLSRGPAPRYQKKARDLGLSSLSVNDSSMLSNRSGLGLLVPSPMSARTPLSGSFIDGKSPGRGVFQGNGRSKSPGRTMPKLAVRGSQKTPGRKSSATTPHKQGSDRFIPNRGATDLERSHQLLINSLEVSSREASNTEDDDLSLKQREYTETMEEKLNDGIPKDNRILHFSSKCQETKESHSNNLKVLYSTGKSSSSKATCTRHIPSEPEKVLDAPDLQNDYYLHLMDWSANNHLAVALGCSLFIWNGGDGSITLLTQFEDPDYICSVSWIKEGYILAVGISNNETQLWDVGQQKMVRSMAGHIDRVCSLSWNEHILSSGAMSGQIIHHDVRSHNHVTATLSHHTQAICGLKWSKDGKLLASGGNDNLVYIYERANNSSYLHRFTDHQGAVKGLAWCPWQNNLLASGGGTADRTIRLWNCSNGTCLKTVNTNSQVSSLLWSEHYREIISGHGFVHNQLTLWKYPGFTKIKDLTGHSNRVMELCLSPDGQTVVSAASDETLRLWKCWAVDKKDKKSLVTDKKHPISALAKTIR